MSKNYAIMRIAKLSSNNHFARVLNHNFRNYENTPGVDKDGVIITDGPCQNYKDIKENLKLRNQMIKDSTGYEVRKNRVRGFEILFAVNQEFMKNHVSRDAYFELAKEWSIETFGTTNYLNSSIHLDEDGAAHMHIMVTCLSKDKDGVTSYNAKNWVSNRASLTELQDSWYAKVQNLGLERGKSAKYTHEYHKSKQEYVKLLQKDLDALKSLSEEERNLLAVRGLQKVRENQNIASSIKSHEVIKSIDFEALENDIISDDNFESL